MDITLDPSIRIWIFVPIAFITFLFGLAMHYVRILAQTERTATKEQIKDSQQLARAQLIRANGKFVCPRAYHMRKDYFLNAETGILRS